MKINQEKGYIKQLLLLGCYLSLWGCQQAPPTGITVNVVKVISGNTLEVVSAENATSQRVRLIGITAPSVEQRPWGSAAKQALETLVRQQTVILEFDQETEDAYGRQLGYIWHQDQLINEELVKQGYALAEEWFPNTQYSQRFEYAENRARILGLGIWSAEKPMRLTPSQFRRQSPQLN